MSARITHDCIRSALTKPLREDEKVRAKGVCVCGRRDAEEAQLACVVGSTKASAGCDGFCPVERAFASPARAEESAT